MKHKRYDPENRPLEIDVWGYRRQKGVPESSYTVGATYKSSAVRVVDKSQAQAEKRVRELLDVTSEQWARAKAKWKKRVSLAKARRKKTQAAFSTRGQPKKRVWSTGGCRVHVTVFAKTLRLAETRLAEVLDALGGAKVLKKRRFAKRLMLRNDR